MGCQECSVKGEGVKENISTDSRKGNTHIIIAKEPKDTSC